MGYIGNRPTAVPLTSADFVDDSVTLAKMAGLARGKLIYGDTSGDPAALAVGAADEVLTHDGTDFDWAAASGGGLTGADQWRTNTDVSGDVDPLTNVERVDDGGFAGIGSAMTQSSGVFTFPATGIWLIRFDALFRGTTDSRFNNAFINYTTNDAVSYDVGAYNSCLTQQTNSSSAYGFCSQAFIFDVTSTSTHKVKFNVSVDDNITTLQGISTANNTTFTFLKLGDT